MGQNYFKIKRGTNLEPTAVSANSAGDLQAASSLSNQLVYHDGSATAVVATATNTLTLTNKTLTAPVITDADISATAGSLSNVDVDANSLSVTGDTVLEGVTASDLAVTGNLTSDTAQINDFTATGIITNTFEAQASSVLGAAQANSLAVTANASITGNLGVTGNLTVVGSSTISTLSLSSATASGSVQIDVDLTVGDDVSIGGDLAVTGLSSVTGAASFDSEFNLKHLSATPSNPATGRNKVYYKNDGKLYQLTSGGSESLLGAGAYVPSGTRASPTNITAVGGITFGGQQRELAFIQGSGGHINVTANPQISAGTSVGQELTLIGRNDSQTVTLENGDGLELNGEAVLGASDSLSLVWDGTSWVEISRN